MPRRDPVVVDLQRRCAERRSLTHGAPCPDAADAYTCRNCPHATETP